MASHGADDPYHRVDAVKAGMTGAMITGAAGLFAASIKNAMRVENVGSLGVFTMSGGIITTFAAVGGAYEFTKAASANLREKNDPYNTAIAGFVAGSLLGVRVGRMPAVVGYGAATSVVLSAYEFTGGNLRGKKPEVEGMDEYQRKEHLRKNRRRPIEETLAEIGEGRGIEPPGYQERRRERLKEKYGVEINPVSAEA